MSSLHSEPSLTRRKSPPLSLDFEALYLPFQSYFIPAFFRQGQLGWQLLPAGHSISTSFLWWRGSSCLKRGLSLALPRVIPNFLEGIAQALPPAALLTALFPSWNDFVHTLSLLLWVLVISSSSFPQECELLDLSLHSREHVIFGSTLTHALYHCCLLTTCWISLNLFPFPKVIVTSKNSGYELFCPFP